MITCTLPSNRAGLVLWLVAAGLLAACQQVDHAITTTTPKAVISSPTPLINQVAATLSPSTPTVTTLNPATAVPESDESQIDLLALKATPTQSPDPDAILITDEPILVGGDVRLQGWSPDGRFLAYFEYTEEQIAQSPADIPGTVPGTFTFYDTVTGQKCQRYSLDGRFSHEGPGYGQRFTWLANGDLFIFTQDGQIIQANIPCGQEEDLTALFPEQMLEVLSHSPDEQLLLLTGATVYWLYDVESRAIYSIDEITPDSFNNLNWSPEGKHIGVTLAGDYTGFQSPIGGSRVVEVSTGQIIARYDWEPANALDGTFGGPVWLNENEMVITVSLDQGPFFMTVDGEVRPLLPLFGLEFEHNRYMPRVDIYTEPNTGQHHILLTDMGWGEERLSPQIFHEDTETVEMLELSQSNEVYMTANGVLVADRSGTNWVRPITAVGEPWQQPPRCVPVWYTPTTKYFARSRGIGHVDIYTWPDCQLKLKLQFAWRAEGARYLGAGISPDDQWLVLTPTDEQGRSQALFVVPLPEMEG